MKQKQNRNSKRSSNSAATATATVKHHQQKDTKQNRNKLRDSIVSLASKIRNSKKNNSKLSMRKAEHALAIALKLRVKLRKTLLIDSLFALINSDTKVSTHKSSTFVSKFNAACTDLAKRMRDSRYDLYCATVALYDAASMFADKSIVCFAIDTVTTTSTRTVAVSTCKVLDKVASEKALATDIKLISSLI